MKITRTSKLTGIERTFELPIIGRQFQELEQGKKPELVVPHLSKEVIHWIKTGVTIEEKLEQAELKKKERKKKAVEKKEMAARIKKEPKVKKVKSEKTKRK